MAEISIRNLRFGFKEGLATPVLGGLNLVVPEGEIVTLFGPNGCGKTTLIRIMAGLERNYEGDVDLVPKDDERITVGVVPQNPVDYLLPWKRVCENLEFYMEAASLGSQSQALDALLATMGLSEHKSLYPYQLSGGLRQKLALACAISYQPSILFLDEPFSALDYMSSIQIAQLIRQQWEQTRRTTICVCHQPDHSILIGNRVCVLSPSPARVISEVEVPAVDRLAPGALERWEMQKARATILRYFNQGIGRPQEWGGYATGH